MGASAWNRNCKRATFANRALQAHVAAVEFNKLLDEREPYACALIRPRVSTLDAMKPFEHTLPLVFGNPNACVADLQLDIVCDRFKDDFDRACEGKLKRVG